MGHMACSICNRPDVDAVNAALRLRSNRDVAAQFGCNRETLRRHRKHVAQDVPRLASVPSVRAVAGIPERRTPEGIDRRLMRGQMLVATVERLAAVEDVIALARRDLSPELGLRERHLVYRTLVMLHREARGHLDVIARVGGLDTPDVDDLEATTMEDVRRQLQEIEAELEAANG